MELWMQQSAFIPLMKRNCWTRWDAHWHSRLFAWSCLTRAPTSNKSKKSQINYFSKLLLGINNSIPNIDPKFSWTSLMGQNPLMKGIDEGQVWPWHVPGCQEGRFYTLNMYPNFTGSLSEWICCWPGCHWLPLRQFRVVECSLQWVSRWVCK